ncbi:hypothetical protein [Spiroplasma endosymbiont of Aspidapion aeneum]|uniref:hypothetical protein n=1 Tax=Spiroplasma endosymbiont of Aspidapion aeneum TaxID=3066276 RepID=UPI00313D83E9
MKYRFKNKLAIFSTFGFLTMCSSSVVSCQQSIHDIDVRKNDPNTYAYYLKTNLKAPSPFLSQSSSDFYIFSDCFATITSFDNFGRIQGDLAKRTGQLINSKTNQLDDDNDVKQAFSKSRYVGDHNKEFSYWQYHFRENLSWSNADGVKQAELNPSDFMNVCKAVIYKGTGSPTSSLYTKFIKNADKIYAYFSGGSDAYVYTYTNTPENGCPYLISLTQLDAAQINAAGVSSEPKEIIKSYDITKDTNNSWINSSIWNYLGVTYNDENKEVTTDAGKKMEARTLNISMESKCDYFESILSYAAFAPTSSHMLGNIIRGTSINSDLFSKKLWYSGAYRVTGYKVSSYINLQKNDNYFEAENTKIKNLKWIITTTLTSSTDQNYFESGITSQFNIYSTNVNAWKKYIGDDYAKSNSSAITEMYDPNYPYSWGLYYNYNFNSQNAASPIGKKIDGKSSNVALISNIVRAFIQTNLNRSTYDKAFSNLYDKSGASGKKITNGSSWETNTLTGDGLSYDKNNTDYATYVQKEYENIANGGGYRSDAPTNKASDEATLAGNSKAVKGSDAYLNNDALLGNIADMNGDQIKTQAQLLKAVQDYISYEAKKGDIKLVNGKVQFDWLAQSNLRTFKYLVAMVSDFNDIKGNPLEIVLDGTADTDIYNATLQNGGTSFELWGWGPDYSDPSTYLNTFSLGGDMTSYLGLQSIFTNTSTTSSAKFALDAVQLSNGKKASDIIYNKKNEKTVDSNTYKDKDISSITKALGFDAKQFGYLQSSPYWKKFIIDNTEYSNSVRAVNEQGTEGVNPFGDYTVSSDENGGNFVNKRFSGYAVSESNAIMQDFLWLPLYRYSKYVPSLSYIYPYQGSIALCGTSFLRHTNIDISSTLIKRSEFNLIKNDYNNKAKIAGIDYSAFRIYRDW